VSSAPSSRSLAREPGSRPVAAGAEDLRHLDGDLAGRARRPVDQDPFAGLERGTDPECADRRLAGVDDRGGEHVAEAVRDRHAQGVAHECLLGHATEGRFREQEPDALAALGASDAVDAGHERKGASHRVVAARCPRPCGVRERGGRHSDDGQAVTRCGVVELAVDGPLVGS